MTVDPKTGFIIRLNEISEFVKQGDEFFPDEYCNFLCAEFNLEACALFEVKQNHFHVLGKSKNANNDIVKDSIRHCDSCKFISEKKDSEIHYNSSCKIHVSDNIINESCSLINCTIGNSFLIKLSRQTAFSKEEKDSLEKTIQFTGFLIAAWLSKKSNGSPTMAAFSNIVEDTAKEIKTIANTVIGYTNVLLEESSSETNKEYSSLIKRNAQNLLLNMNDLGEISKTESNRLEKNKQKIVLMNFVGNIVELFRKKLVNKKIDIKIDASQIFSRPIDLDDQKLRYIFSNLLFLSSSHAEENSEIEVKINAAAGNKIQFTIGSRGKVLPPDTLNNFFEPYSLSKKSEFKSSGLSGLSLTLVKKYVNYMGGEISVSNDIDKGIIFTFTINGEVMSGIESTISKLPKPTTKNRVLVIEDDYATSKLLNNYLNKWGYDPVIVSTEEQAFNIISSEQLLAVILDIELPNANGLELLKKIHEHPNTKNVPVVVCSIEPEQQKAFMMGAVEYFVKPINYNYLVEVLTSYKLRKDSNILCVDDDVPTLNLVKQAIESAGFNAVAENVSANVMELINDKQIDLAIVDLDMPHPNGFELIKIIKSDKRFAHLPIIIYTGKENYKEDLKNIEGLFEELLDKRSTNIEDLAETINAMINRYDVPPPQEEVLAKKGGTKILLAEDYKHSQIIVTRLLKKNNFEDIVVVENGEDAVKMAREQVFDLILMDMQMPIMNGFEATESIRQMQDYKNTPIIALTAFAMKGDREKCLEAGATDYIPKPIDSKEFIDKVKYYTNVT